MTKISIIKYSEIENERLDASFYSPEVLKILKDLRNINTVEITSLTRQITHLPGFLRDKYLVYVKRGIPYLLQSNISIFEGIKLNKDIVYIPKYVHEKFKTSKVHENDILLTVTGAYYGEAVPIIENYGELNASPDIVIITPFKTKISSIYLAIFLNSKYGKLQLRRWSSGASRPRILTQNIRKILVPIFPETFQHSVDELIKQGYEKRRIAYYKYQQAEEKLYELLGVSKEEIEKLEAKNTYETNFKEVIQTFRFDAEYYHPKYIELIKLLKRISFSLTPLKEVVEISKDILDPTKEQYKTKRFKYVPIAKIDESGEIFEWDEFYGWQAPSRARMLIRKDDILIPSLAGTFDKIALVPEELDRQLATTGCFVIRAKQDYPEFLFLLFRTTLFKRQLEQLTTGAIMSAVPKTVFGSLLVPVIPKDKQEEIVSLVKDYFKLKKESRKIIQMAIRKVEETIENVSRPSK